MHEFAMGTRHWGQDKSQSMNCSLQFSLFSFWIRHFNCTEIPRTTTSTINGLGPTWANRASLAHWMCASKEKKVCTYMAINSIQIFRHTVSAPRRELKPKKPPNVQETNYLTLPRHWQANTMMLWTVS